MAVIMMDSGMINTIAEALVSLTGDLYPLAAPVIGLLGAFITGSNTNSNVIFGYLQEAAIMYARKSKILLAYCNMVFYKLMTTGSGES